jgi:polysaccharide export outer membrane protein
MKTLIVTALSFALLPGADQAQRPVGTSGTSTAPSTTSTPAPAPRPGPAAAAATSADYRLVAGDKLRIEVYKDAQLSQALQVRPDGKITLPLAGDIPAAGRTPVELRDAIASALQEYIAKPVVTVIVTETTPQVVYVTGEVNKPGALALVHGEMSILQAIAMAGGFTDFANKKDVRVLRKGSTGMQTLRFNYKEALEDDNRRAPLQLLPGDTVVVK